MIEGSHFHSLDEYLKSFQLDREKSKTDIQKNKVQRQGNLTCGLLSLSKIFTSQPLSTLCIWPFVHSGSKCTINLSRNCRN